MSEGNNPTGFWAVCETGHGLWSGPERSTHDQAEADASDHDNVIHGGSPAARILSN